MKYNSHSVVETDNLGRDYPNESFLIRNLPKEACEIVANAINNVKCVGPEANRFWKVVEDTYDKPYELQPGFEP